MKRQTKIFLFASGLFVGAVIVLFAWMLAGQEKRAFVDTTRTAPETNKAKESLVAPILVNTTYKNLSTTTESTIDISYPALHMSAHPDIEAQANVAIKNFIEKIVADFAQETAGESVEKLPANTRSSLTMNWDPMLISPEVISVRFNYSAYIAGTAHPNNMSRVLNYDLTQGKVLNTQDLFISPDNALSLLSAFARDTLKKEMGNLSSKEFEEQVIPGTEPTIENFGAVALTKQGFLIIFNPYQVADYARGTQDILMSTKELEGKITVTAQNALRDAK